MSTLNAKYKIGDTLICKPGFTGLEGSGGAGYKEGIIGVVGHTSQNGNQTIYWFKDGTHGGRGVYEKALVKVDSINNNYETY